MKKFLAFMLSLAMLLSLLAVPVFASEITEVKTGDSGGIVEWLNGDTVTQDITIKRTDNGEYGTAEKPITINIKGTVTVSGTITVESDCYVVFHGAENAKLVAGKSFTDEILNVGSNNDESEKFVAPHVTFEGKITLEGIVNADAVKMADGATVTYTVEEQTTTYRDVPKDEERIKTDGTSLEDDEEREGFSTYLDFKKDNNNYYSQLNNNGNITTYEVELVEGITYLKDAEIERKSEEPDPPVRVQFKRVDSNDNGSAYVIIPNNEKIDVSIGSKDGMYPSIEFHNPGSDEAKLYFTDKSRRLLLESGTVTTKNNLTAEKKQEDGRFLVRAEGTQVAVVRDGNGTDPIKITAGTAKRDMATIVMPADDAVVVGGNTVNAGKPNANVITRHGVYTAAEDGTTLLLDASANVFLKEGGPVKLSAVPEDNDVLDDGILTDVTADIYLGTDTSAVKVTQKDGTVTVDGNTKTVEIPQNAMADIDFAAEDQSVGVVSSLGSPDDKITYESVGAAAAVTITGAEGSIYPVVTPPKKGAGEAFASGVSGSKEQNEVNVTLGSVKATFANANQTIKLPGAFTAKGAFTAADANNGKDVTGSGYLQAGHNNVTATIEKGESTTVTGDPGLKALYGQETLPSVPATMADGPLEGFLITKPSQPTHTITVEVTNGTASWDDEESQISGTITVENGEDSPEISFAPKSDGHHYVLESATLNDGTDVREAVKNGSYTFDSVKADDSITVVYALDDLGGTDGNPGDDIPDKYQVMVTFKVKNGYWGAAGATPSDGADKVVVLTRMDGGKYSETAAVYLSVGDIPVVGNNPATNYTAGSWDTTPDTATEISTNTTYIYTYASNGGNPGGGVNPGTPSVPSIPQPSTPPSVLNTEEHYAYVIGLPDGEVKPGSTITRAEIATIFFRLLTDEARETYWSSADDPENDIVFADATENDWFNHAVYTLVNLGILEGSERADGLRYFRPSDPITRAEMATMVVRFYDIEEVFGSELDGAFKDVDEGAWYENFVNLAQWLGLVEGNDGLFRPTDNLTRAEAMTIFNRLLARHPEVHGFDDVKDKLIQWPDLDPKSWYYVQVVEATNSHKCDETTQSGKTTHKVTLTANRDWAQLEKNN